MLAPARLLIPCVLCALFAPVLASSHREAPHIAFDRAADNTDVYAFVAPEAPDRVSLIANYVPLQEAAGGPIHYPGRNNVAYLMHIDVGGDATPEYTFTFRFGTQYSTNLVQTDDGSSTRSPFIYRTPGTITDRLDPDLAVFEPFTVDVTTAAGNFPVTNTTMSSTSFFKPLDAVGDDVQPDYESYVSQHVYNFEVSGLPGLTGRLFVGQRRDPFVMSYRRVLGLDASPGNPSSDSHAGHSVLSFALDLPKDVITNDGADPVIGVWATARVPQSRVLNLSPTHPSNVVLPPSPTDPEVQVSRVGMPLSNMLLISVDEKDRFNAQTPADDQAQFERFYTHPALAALLGYPSSDRSDLVEIFLTGIPGVNQTTATGDMLRLDTRVPPVAPEFQDPLGLFGDPPDPAGFPNGRRLGDDVIDIALRALQGQRFGVPGPFDATDGANTDPTSFDSTFPYMLTPFSRSRDPLCVSLTSSLTPDRSAFAPVEEAYVPGSAQDRIIAPLPTDPEVYYLIDIDTATLAVNRVADTLEFRLAEGAQ